MRLLVATRNRGKLVELEALLRPRGFELVDLDDVGIAPSRAEDDVEAWPTFEENALAKARYFFAQGGGLPVVADDSGLEVEALGGRPGVRSKRYSGRDDLQGRALDAANNARLMSELASETNFAARFVCAAAFVSSDLEVAVRGEVPGVILTEPRGGGGFGYDAHFYSPELGRTFAEASVAEKERVSHRARAFRALLERVPAPRGAAH